MNLSFGETWEAVHNCVKANSVKLGVPSVSVKYGSGYSLNRDGQLEMPDTPPFIHTYAIPGNNYTDRGGVPLGKGQISFFCCAEPQKDLRNAILKSYLIAGRLVELINVSQLRKVLSLPEYPESNIDCYRVSSGNTCIVEVTYKMLYITGITLNADTDNPTIIEPNF